MLERRGHAEDMDLWMEQGRGSGNSGHSGQLLVLDGQSWGLFQGC